MDDVGAGEEGVPARAISGRRPPRNWQALGAFVRRKPAYQRAAAGGSKPSAEAIGARRTRRTRTRRSRAGFAAPFVLLGAAQLNEFLFID